MGERAADVCENRLMKHKQRKCDGEPNLYLSRERIWRGLQSGPLKTTPQGLKEFAGINAWANGMRQSDLRECGIASDIMIASKTLQLLEKQQKIKCLNLCLRIISRRMTYRLQASREIDMISWIPQRLSLRYLFIFGQCTVLCTFVE